MKTEVRGGLQELAPDGRDYQLGAIYFLPNLSELPSGFWYEVDHIKHQGDTDYCTAFASCGMSELQEDVELNPIYSFALSKAITGDVEEWGQNTRAALKAHTKYGAIPESIAEYKTKKDVNNTKARHIENWKNEYDIRNYHQKKSYFKVTGPYDTFDNIRAAIWKFRDKKLTTTLGVAWAWSLSEKMLTNKTAGNPQFGHMMYCIGWKEIDGEPYLIAQNSYGKDAGDNGVHYISRDVINKDTDKYGVYMLVDLSREEAEHRLKNGITEKDNWLLQLFKIILNIFK